MQERDRFDLSALMRAGTVLPEGNLAALAPVLGPQPRLPWTLRLNERYRWRCTIMSDVRQALHADKERMKAAQDFAFSHAVEGRRLGISEKLQPPFLKRNAQ